MSFLHVDQLVCTEAGRTVLHNVSFALPAKQNLAIAGATGSGKTTLLKAVAGLVQPTSGEVTFNGVAVKGPKEKLLPGHPSIAYLSQHFELRNHYRVSELLAMSSKVDEGEANLIADVCRVGHLLSRWSHQLSGGERQRIALARALVTAPELLLLDEPFSNLDPFHKNLLKTVIDDLRTSLGISLILVSHEPADTLSWADEILVLKDGGLVQVSSPEEIYHTPANEYVAGLFGKFTRLSLELAKELSAHSDVQMQDIGRYLRPEDVELTVDGEGTPAIIERLSFLGAGYEVVLALRGQKVLAFSTLASLQAGQTVFIRLRT